MEIRQIRRDLVRWLLSLPPRYGPTVLLQLRYPTFIVTLPDDIKHILATNPRNYVKAGGLAVAKDILGKGLLSSEPPLQVRQRKVMQPMFHRNSIAGFATLMAEATTRHAGNLREGDTINVAVMMMELAMDIVGQALFSYEFKGAAREIGLASAEAQRLLTRRQNQMPIPLWVPTPSNFRYRRAIRQINQTVHELIASRRKLKEQPQDLMGMLLDARFEDGSPMPDEQIRDEVSTILMAGHETVANMLTWTFYLISQHPEVEARLETEWREQLGGRPPDLADLPNLKFTDNVIAETMRLYPPAWTLARRALKADILPSGLELQPGDEILLPQYICHRNPEVFPDPEAFKPERWTAQLRSSLSPFVYFPFGAGPRYCIGEQFARMEATIILATLGQRVRFTLAPGHRVAREALITLRPRYGMNMVIHQRNASATAAHA